jgi:hypothetical protein
MNVLRKTLLGDQNPSGELLFGLGLGTLENLWVVKSREALHFSESFTQE